MRSAVSLHLRCMGHPGDEALMAAALKGRQYSQLDCLIGKRGAITRPMLLKLLKLSDDVVPREYKDWFVILAATGLRRGQMARLRISHCKFANDLKPPAWIVLADRDFKGRKGRASRACALEEHVCNPDWNAELNRIEARTSSDNSDPIVGYGFLPGQALNYLKAAAAALGWDEDLVWVIHGFRHGAVV